MSADGATPTLPSPVTCSGDDLELRDLVPEALDGLLRPVALEHDFIRGDDRTRRGRRGGRYGRGGRRRQERLPSRRRNRMQQSSLLGADAG